MPSHQGPPILPRTSEPPAHATAGGEQPSCEEVRPDPASTIRMKDFREYLRLIEAFKKARTAQGLTPAQLADRCAMDEPSLSALLSGKTPNPALSTLFRVAAALGLDLVLGLRPSDNAAPGAD